MVFWQQLMWFILVECVRASRTQVDIFVKSGDTINLKCNSLKSKILWYGPCAPVFTNNEECKNFPYTDGQKLNPELNTIPIRLVQNGEQGIHNLEIRNFSMLNEGIYKCEIISTVDSELNTKLYNVTLEEAPKNMKIVNETEFHTIKGTAGEKLDLVCTVDSGNPKEKLLWLRNMTIVSEGGHGEITYSLIPSKSDHFADFVCSAHNQASEKPLKRSVHLDISYKPSVSLIMSPSRFIEGHSAKLCCHVDSHPKSNYLKWTKNNTTVKENGKQYDCLVFSAVTRSDSGSYGCFSNNSLGNDESFLVPIIYYPPDVVIQDRTFTTEKTRTELLCIPSGIPENYTFKGWEHTSEFGEHIRYLSNADKRRLVLQRTEGEENINQDTGIYICRVTNGIADVHGKVQQEGKFHFKSQDKPIIMDKTSRIHFGVLGRDSNITVFAYNDDNFTQIQITDQQTGQELDESEIEIIRQNSTVKFHGVPVTVKSYAVTFETRSPKGISLCNYTIVLCNNYGCNDITVGIQRAVKPEKPRNVSFTTCNAGLFIRWFPGFNSDLKQMFFIEYSLQNSNTWNQFGPIVGHENEEVNYFVTTLSLGKSYSFRLYSKSSLGRSEYTPTIVVFFGDMQQSNGKTLQWVIIGCLTTGLCFLTFLQCWRFVRPYCIKNGEEISPPVYIYDDIGSVQYNMSQNEDQPVILINVQNTESPGESLNIENTDSVNGEFQTEIELPFPCVSTSESSSSSVSVTELNSDGYENPYQAIDNEKKEIHNYTKLEDENDNRDNDSNGCGSPKEEEEEHGFLSQASGVVQIEVE